MDRPPRGEGISVPELIQRWEIQQAERARQDHLKLFDLAFERGLATEGLSPGAIIDFLHEVMVMARGQRTGIDLSRRILDERLNTGSKDTTREEVTDWQIARSLIVTSYLDDEVIRARARSEAEVQEQIAGLAAAMPDTGDNTFAGHDTEAQSGL